jgi:hypothetical protein
LVELAARVAREKSAEQNRMSLWNREEGVIAVRAEFETFGALLTEQASSIALEAKPYRGALNFRGDGTSLSVAMQWGPHGNSLEGAALDGVVWRGASPLMGQSLSRAAEPLSRVSLKPILLPTGVGWVGGVGAHNTHTTPELADRLLRWFSSAG